MPYQAPITRANPSAFVFLLDQSHSMSKLMSQAMRHRKKEESTLSRFLADIINETLLEIILECTPDTDVLDRFHIAAVSYNEESNVKNAFQGILANQFFNKISTIANNPLEEFKHIEGQNIEIETWIKPIASGKTPMVAAMRKVRDLLKQWCMDHPTSFPPIVLHVTDGEPTDGTPNEVSSVAEEIKSISTVDGTCLLGTIHVTTLLKKDILFPSSENHIPKEDAFAKNLFEMSSVMPSSMIERARSTIKIETNARLYGYNAGPQSVITFFRVGTIVARS